jgi:hypothetical protein
MKNLDLLSKSEGCAAKPPTIYWGGLWLIGWAVAAFGIGVDLLLPSFTTALGRDFTNFWVAGRLVLEGEPLCAFDLQCFRVALAREVDILSQQNFSYPPHVLSIAAPFALLPYYAALACWTVLGAALFYKSAKLWVPCEFPPILAILTPAAAINIWNGHYGFLLGALWLLFYDALRSGKFSRAGVFAGLLTFKPHMGLLVALSALPHPKTVVVASTATIGLIFGSSLLFGADAWRLFIFGTTGTQFEILSRQSTEFYFMMMPSAYVQLGRGSLATFYQIAFAMSAIWIMRRNNLSNPFTAATATFIILPYSFNYDMTVVCLGFAILLRSRWASLTAFEKVTLSFGFLSPELTYWGLPLAPPLLLTCLYIQQRVLERDERLSHGGGAGRFAGRSRE